MYTCRPTVGQRAMYSGHKCQHYLKFQSVMASYGLTVNLFGPIEGSQHDILGESGLLEQLDEGRFRDYCGDPAYPIRRRLTAPFRGEVDPDMMAFNKEMSRCCEMVRQSEEWGFGKISTYFAYLDFKENQKVLLQPVAKYFNV